MKTSVIIATHARETQLLRLLRALAPQLRAGERELLIAENGTPAPVRLPNDVAVTAHLHEVRPGKCRAQNRAIGMASGEIIVCLDDDLIVDSRYLDEVERFFDSHREFAAMKGRILPASDPAQAAGPQAIYMDLPIVDHGEQVIEVRGVLGANMAFRASALCTIGLFDERLGPGACGHEEETEISMRLRRAGFKIGYAPRAIAHHEVDPARADRERFIRIARERGRCRTLHERHSLTAALLRRELARLRLAAASVARARVERIAREEKRLATAEGIVDGLRANRAPATPMH